MWDDQVFRAKATPPAAKILEWLRGRLLLKWQWLTMIEGALRIGLPRKRHRNAECAHGSLVNHTRLVSMEFWRSAKLSGMVEIEAVGQ
jgi:hypothetical protein